MSLHLFSRLSSLQDRLLQLNSEPGDLRDDEPRLQGRLHRHPPAALLLLLRERRAGLGRRRRRGRRRRAVQGRLGKPLLKRRLRLKDTRAIFLLLFTWGKKQKGEGEG